MQTNNIQQIKMKAKIYTIAFLFFSFQQVHAQQFITKAVIEYEVKTNVKKTMGNGTWEEMLKENMPQFKTGYYHFIFSGDKSVYKFDHWDEKTKLPDYMKKSDEENVWYFDHGKGMFNMQKNVFGSNFNVEDSLPVIEWKLGNENRIIAGYNCRKAVGKIFDSVYVFAFYTDEITISGGPCSISGLPGMILGMTIPRMYSSWIATKVIVNKIEENDIKPVIAKKYYTSKTLKTAISERVKEWGNQDDPDSKKWMEQLYWSTSL